jgi:triphosphoribosyl-dephospho-CoA synthase
MRFDGRRADRLSSSEVGAAYLAACRAELLALKPGNVHVHADGHGMSVIQFEAAAATSTLAIAARGLGVGQRILRAFRRSWALTHCNTNLGILLLAAPLAQAALEGRGPDLRVRLRRVLAGLGREDAALAFRAIAAANPGGLGASARYDVHAPARVTLLTAMGEARRRDRIARQYVTDYEDVFRIGLPRLAEAKARWSRDGPADGGQWAVAAVYLGFLAAFPDSHVRRKQGLAAARDLRRRAEELDLRLMAVRRPARLAHRLLAFDAELKARGINPGTSADLTVATLFAAGLQWWMSPQSGRR